MGLLDAIDSDEFRFGLGLLAAGGPSAVPMSLGQRFAGAVGQFRAQKSEEEDRALKKMLAQAQIENYLSEAGARRASALKEAQRQQMLGQFLGDISASPEARAGRDALAIGGAQAQAAGVRAGNVGPTVAAADRQQALVPQHSDGRFRGVPIDAIRADLTLNDGKKFGEWLYDAGKPDWTVQDGYAFDKKALRQPGFMPGISTAADGTTTLRMPGPDGIPVVTVPQGAREAVAGYVGARKAAENANTLAPLDRINPATGRPYVGTMADLIEQSRGGVAAAPAGAPAEVPGAPGRPVNNPGNLRPPGASQGFQQFDDPAKGLAAIDAQLSRYGSRGINTLAGVISTWAPPNENPTQQLVANASKFLGVAPDQPLDMANPVVRHQVAAAIVRQEQGGKIFAGQRAPAAPGAAPTGEVALTGPAQGGFSGFAGPADVKRLETDVTTRAGAQGKVNDNWVEKQYNPIREQGGAARSTLENVQVARQALQGIRENVWSRGGEGIGTEQKAVLANVLTSLGVASGNAQMFAANVGKFNMAAAERLWVQLNAASGPQTEGDADRARQTFANLRNVKDANDYILDVVQARALRDEMRAKFYAAALPEAMKGGDLTEVDRQWSAREPSIWSLAPMQRWKGNK